MMARLIGATSRTGWGGVEDPGVGCRENGRNVNVPGNRPNPPEKNTAVRVGTAGCRTRGRKNGGGHRRFAMAAKNLYDAALPAGATVRVRQAVCVRQPESMPMKKNPGRPPYWPAWPCPSVCGPGLAQTFPFLHEHFTEYAAMASELFLNTEDSAPAQHPGASGGGRELSRPSGPFLICR